MAKRSYPVPVRLASKFGVSPGGALRERTLRRAARSPGDPEARDWAALVCSRIDAGPTAVLAGAGVPEMSGCRYYGLIDPDQEDVVIFAVVRDDPIEQATSAFARWTGAGWEIIAPGMEPAGVDYAELDGDLLAEAIEAVTAGGGLLLRATDPKGWLHKPLRAVTASAVVAAVVTAKVFAIVDDYDTTAVLDLIQVAPGPTVQIRKGGAWVADGATLGRLRSVDPPAVVEVPDEAVEGLVKQVDEYDADETPAPVAAAAETATGTGVMVALRPPLEVAEKLAVPDGTPASELHVTLAYLGDAEELSDPSLLTDLVGKVVSAAAPLSGQLSGIGQFGPGPDGTPVYIPVDVPGLSALRERIAAAIGESPLAGNLRTDHGFTPHLTLGYNVSADPVEPTPVDFGSVFVVIGPDEVELPIGSVVAAAWDEQKYKRDRGRFSNKDVAAQPTTAPDTAGTARGIDLANYVSEGGARPEGVVEAAKKKVGGAGGGGGAKKKAGGGGGGGGSAAKKSTSARVTAPAGTAKAAAQAARVDPAKAAAAQAAADAKSSAAQAAAAAKSTKAAHDAVSAKAKEVQATAEAQAADTDAAFDISVAEAAQTERDARNTFDTSIVQQYQAPNADVAAIMSNLAAERDRRAAFDRDRAKSIESEQIRRMKQARVLAASKAASLTAAGVNPPPHSAMPPNLNNYWARGKGALKIRWGVGGDFNRCRKQLAKYLRPDQLAGACASLHKIATGTWPGRGNKH